MTTSEHDNLTAAERAEVVSVLNSIVELELAGAVHDTQYSLMVFGHARIPILDWMRDQAAESLDHATKAGEEVTTLGKNLSLSIGEPVGVHHDHGDEMMHEMLVHERAGVDLYHRLHDLVAGRHIPLEEFTRAMIRREESPTSLRSRRCFDQGADV